MKKNHTPFLIAALMLTAIIIGSSAPTITGHASKDISSKEIASTEVSSFWKSFFKGLFQAVEDESKESESAPSTGNRMDDAVVVVEENPFEDIPKPNIEDRIPCEPKLDACKKDLDYVRDQNAHAQDDLAVCEDESASTADNLDACDDQLSQLLAELRNPSPPSYCESWMSGSAISCNEQCAKKNLQCYGAVIRDIGKPENLDYVCAPSNCYDQSTPACHPEFITGAEERTSRIVRDCMCC